MTTQSALERLRAGRKADVAFALARIERRPRAPEVNRLLDAAVADPRAHVIGLTGPPGVGKSTLIRALVDEFRGQGETVAVVAVDPSSRTSGGALLGDRARMKVDPTDEGVFVRSLAARDRLGGLSSDAIAVTAILRAIYDRVIVETVGVGQSEADIATVADTVVLCVQPGSGDSLQFMKAGIMEIPDVICVTKSDLEAAARRARADVEGALFLATQGPNRTQVQVLMISAQSGEGLDGLVAAINAHHENSCRSSGWQKRRSVQAHDWLRDEILHRFGTDGLQRLDLDHVLANAAGPFCGAWQVAIELSGVRDAAMTPMRPAQSPSR